MNPSPTLYEQVGGPAVLDEVVGRFHHRLLGDPRIGHLFPASRTAELLERQRRYFAALLGGPGGYDADVLAEAHREVPIDDSQVAVALQHLAECLTEAGLSDDVTGRIVAVASRVWWARNWGVNQ